MTSVIATDPPKLSPLRRFDLRFLVGQGLVGELRLRIERP
jgi:hypothetical protein